MSSKKPELETFLNDLVRIGVRELEAALNLAPEQLAGPMRKVADAVCVEYARREIYVPAAYDPRNEEIWRKYGESSRAARAFSPDRITELATEYGLTTRQVYGIIALKRAADVAARQQTLPGLEGE